MQLAAREPCLLEDEGLKPESLERQRGRETGHPAPQDQRVESFA